ncbi:serine hydrolase [Schleiferilactobacillus perolens]|uniref:Penicillin-binding protein (Beta-lactamase class C) n=1 Tax=Schleiferilactobacillus perolens DSM 12744 TaxID=1423792 RepID=A0A0R1MWD9_9LACO|nr:serine hydrolase [Schleiferilactobacillus perolens]KRL12558.1 penicillin-binding protein precursor (Beta-lactamase class C) [Schleiferilactobacillus perolens DSM 12744]
MKKSFQFVAATALALLAVAPMTVVPVTTQAATSQAASNTIQSYRDVATVGGSAISLYKVAGNNVTATGQLPANSAWKVTGKIVVNGQTYYQVSTTQFVADKDVTLASKQTALPARTVIGLRRNATLYSGTGSDRTPTSRTLQAGSVWLTNAKVAVNGTLWYQVAPNLWISDDDVGEMPHSAATPVSMVVKIVDDTPLWDGFQWRYTGRWLPTNSRWKVNATGTTSDGTEYYEVGANQWIKAGSATVESSSSSDSTSQNGVDKLSAAADSELKDHLASEQFVGTLLLIQNGQVIYNQGTGQADNAAGRANGPQSLFQFASVQKSMTAALVAQLIAQGKLSYSDNISHFYPTIPAADNISIRDMLDMTSGLSMTLAVPDTVMTDAQVIQRGLDLLQYDPDQHGQFNYQAINYILLVGVLEQLTGQSYENLVQQNLLNPLGLGADQAGFAWNLAAQPNHTVSYISGNGLGTYDQISTETLADMHSELGTGNMYSTAYALYQMEKAISQGQLISGDQLSELRDSSDGSWAGGLYNYPDHYYAHGVKNWQETIFLMSKDTNTAVVFISNRAYDYDNAAARSAWYWNFVQNASLAN